MKWLVALIVLAQPLTAFSVCVNEVRANLRAGPGTQHKVTWTVGRFTPLIVEARENGWLKVKDQDGELHWIFGQLISRSVQCGAVKVRSTKVYRGPGFDSGTLDYPSADKYKPVRLMGRKNQWYKLKDRFGQTFWLPADRLWRPIRLVRVDF